MIFDDHSYQASPELGYSGVKNLHLRLRLRALHGACLSDFGEMQNWRRPELLARYYL